MPRLAKQNKQGTIMNKFISLALIAGGVILIVFGVIAMDSFSSDVSRFFTGTPTDKSIWLLIGGGVAVLAGLSITFFRPTKA